MNLKVLSAVSVLALVSCGTTSVHWSEGTVPASSDAAYAYAYDVYGAFVALPHNNDEATASKECLAEMPQLIAACTVATVNSNTTVTVRTKYGHTVVAPASAAQTEATKSARNYAKQVYDATNGAAQPQANDNCSLSHTVGSTKISAPSSVQLCKVTYKDKKVQVQIVDTNGFYITKPALPVLDVRTVEAYAYKVHRYALLTQKEGSCATFSAQALPDSLSGCTMTKNGVVTLTGTNTATAVFPSSKYRLLIDKNAAETEVLLYKRFAETAAVGALGADKPVDANCLDGIASDTEVKFAGQWSTLKTCAVSVDAKTQAVTVDLSTYEQ